MRRSTLGVVTYVFYKCLPMRSIRSKEGALATRGIGNAGHSQPEALADKGTVKVQHQHQKKRRLMFAKL